MWFSSDLLWKLRIDLSVLAYSSCQQSKIGAPQIKSCNRRRKVLCAYSSSKDAATQSVMPTDFSDIKDICRNGCLVSDILPNGCWSDGISTAQRIQSSLFSHQLIEEPWLGQASAISHPILDKNGGNIDIAVCYDKESQKAMTLSKAELAEDSYNLSLSEIVGSKEVPHDPLTSYPPVEEPWLLESSFGSYYSYRPDILSQTVTIPNVKNSFLVDDLSHKEETDAISVDDSISTVILINSSICTMQRIAVLENDKLVELLLEPVKNNVQCDSVYLGLVSKLVPQMGGAFVNIGSSKLSFMDLNPNREPFIFFPFNANLKELDRSTFGSSTLQMDVSDTMSCNGIVDELDDLEDDQSEDEFIDARSKGTESSSGFDGNVNGSVTGSGRAYQERSWPPSIEDLNSIGSKNPNQNAGVKVDGCEESLWAQVQNGSRIIVQVIKEGLGTKGPTVTAYPKLRSRFWVLSTRSNTLGISKKITGAERIRLKAIAKTLQPPGFGLTLRTVASSHTLEELKKDFQGLLSTWKSIVEHAESAALAADEGVEGAVPVMLHRAMGQTLSVVQDYFNDKVMKMIVDSSRTYHEVTKYLQDIDPNLCSRVELYGKRTPLFDEYRIEDEIHSILQKRVLLVNGGYLVIEQTEALVSIDVNGGQCMLGEGTSQEKAILEVNLVAAKQIARELRLRDIGGIIVVDFIDMEDDSNKKLVYEEMKKAAERDRSNVKVSELSRNGLMEITRKRVRPSVSFMISETCCCCNATGRVEALETSFSKIEHKICRLLSSMQQKADPDKPKSWPRFILRVDRHMCNYLTCGKKTRLAVLSSSLKVWILLKVARGLARGAFELKALAEDTTHKKQHAVAISVLRPKELVTIKKWKSSGK